MEHVLAGLSWKICLVYLDDVTVYGSSFSDQMENLEKVLQRIRWARLKLSPEKCILFQREVTYLGYIVNENGVKVDARKLEAVAEWLIPRNVTEVKRFLGLASYYRRFIANFAEIVKPLHKLTEKDVTFAWTNESDRAFKKLKEVLCSAPILVFPREGAEFILDTDASGESVGAVLSQKSEEGDKKVIAYYSKVLSKRERQYCVTRRELLAVVQAVSHFHCYLYGQNFKIRTDHSALQWLLRFRHLEGQVARWMEVLGEYDFRIEFRPGKGHQNADAMLRRPCVNHNCKHCDRVETRENIFKENMETFETDGDKVSGSSTATNIIARVVETENKLIKIISKEDLRNKQLQDPHIAPIMRWLEQSSQRPEWGNVSTESEDTKVLWAQWDSLTLREYKLYRVWETLNANDVELQLVVPKSLRDTVLRQAHDCVTSGHFGISKTLVKVKQVFYWIGCRNDVKAWCKQCDLCNSRKGPKRREKAQLQIYQVGSPMERIAIDVLGPLPKTDDGNKYLLMCMDYFTKWPEVYPIANQEAETIAKLLVEQFVCRFGVPLQTTLIRDETFVQKYLTKCALYWE